MNIFCVQFKVTERDFHFDLFRVHVEDFYKKTEPGDLIIFPEDIGLLVAFEGISAQTVTDAIQQVYLKNEGKIKEKFQDSSLLKQLFLSLTDEFAKGFYEFFSALSAKYNVYTMACNNMAEFKRVGESYFPVNSDVLNTCFVFDESGRVLQRQSKVNLTKMEAGLGIDCARIEDVKTFKLNGIRFGIAISLDAFSVDYIYRLRDAEIVVQPDANPQRWNGYLENGRWQPEEWMDSSYYIAQRLPDVKYVVNPMMVGSLFDIRFEGQSCIAKKADMNDTKMGYIGNQLTSGFAGMMNIEDYDPKDFVERTQVVGRDLDYPEGVIQIEV